MRVIRHLSFIVAVLAMVLSSAVAVSAQADYTDVPLVSAQGTANADGSFNATIVLDDLYAPGSVVTLTAPDGTTVTTTVPADRTLSLTLSASFGGSAIAIAGTNAGGAAVSSSTVVNVVGGASTTPTAVPAATATAAPAATATAIPNVVLGTTVVPANNGGFTTGIPTQPAMAVTGSNTGIPVLVGVSLLGVGGLALFAARRRQLNA